MLKVCKKLFPFKEIHTYSDYSSETLNQPGLPGLNLADKETVGYRVQIGGRGTMG